MNTQHLELIKESDKSEIYLSYDNSRHFTVIEKHLLGNISVYQNLKDISHPYLPIIFEVIFTNDQTIVIEEHISGNSVAKIKATEKQLTKWFFQLCDVLSFLHKRGILHRDIKPSNLLIGRDGNIRLIDFDAARIAKANTDSDTRLLGTRGYAPPEQYGFAQTNERSDIYALGVTFRELLGNVANKLRWKRVLNKCTALEPKRRYGSISQLKRSVIFSKFLRCVILPVILSCIMLVSGFMLWSYTADTDVHEAIDIVFRSRRDSVFESVDMAQIKNSTLTLIEFPGDEAEIHRRISSKSSDKTYISTGYSADGGYLLLGGFSTTYRVATGDLIYHSFDGLYYMDIYQVIHHIPPDACIHYAPAVLKLYELDIFD